MNQKKKRILISGILGEIVLSVIVITGIIVFIKEPSIKMKIISALVIVDGLFQMCFLIPSCCFKNI